MISKKKSYTFRRYLSLALLFLFFSGCASHSPESTAEKISKPGRLQSADIKGKEFVLRAYYRFDHPGTPLRIYLEGDGRAWLSRTQASRNPSPKNPVALQLAAQDVGKNVMYIARPCQYVSFSKNPQCKYPYWTHKRFAPEIIDSVSAVIDIGKERAKAKQLEIIGFSGGGAVAILIAAHRLDVNSIRTVAGNLDHKVWTKHHQIDPLNGSLNAADVAQEVEHIPQIHYVGQDDKIIGSYVAESFRSKTRRDTCINIQTIPGVTHNQGWEQIWSRLIRTPVPKC